jgi:dolichyl-phosphate-mannose--protein O-mannosyl transferase
MKNTSKEKYWVAGVIVAIIAAGAVLHFYRIGYPDRPVFDEVHFATYSADYITGHVFEDIHPPLGKLIYASVLAFYPPADLANSQFVNILRSPSGPLILIPNEAPYSNFPYVALRIVDSLFGIALPVALYFFMRNLGAGRVPATLAAVFVLFDNAFLLNSRLILIDGMFLTFGIAALAFYFHRHRFVTTAGILFGLALAVKLTAIVFVGPVVAAYFLAIAAGKKERRAEFAHGLRFLIIGFVVLGAVWLAGTFYFSSSARLGALSALGFGHPGSETLTPAWQAANPFKAWLLADIGEFQFSLSNYVEGNPHDGESPWYFWPAMQTPIYFYAPFPGDVGGGDILFTGNPIVWLASTFAVIAALAVCYRYLRDYLKKKVERYPFFVLLAGYVLAMLPFVTFVHRSTFLYHYLPALLFAIGLLGWFVGEWLGVREWKDVTMPKAFLFVMILLVVFLGFLHVAPLTYGL